MIEYAAGFVVGIAAGVICLVVWLNITGGIF